MSIESDHWYRVDRAHEDRCAAADAREIAIGAKVDAFHEHAGLWVDGEFLGWDRAYELVWESQAYDDWYRANKIARGAEQERLAKEFKPLLKRLLDTAITTIASWVVDREIEDAA